MYIPMEHRNKIRSNNTIFTFVRYQYLHIMKVQQRQYTTDGKCMYCYFDKNPKLKELYYKAKDIYSCGDVFRESLSCDENVYIGNKLFTIDNHYKLIRRYKLK